MGRPGGKCCSGCRQIYKINASNGTIEWVKDVGATVTAVTRYKDRIYAALGNPLGLFNNMYQVITLSLDGNIILDECMSFFPVTRRDLIEEYEKSFKDKDIEISRDDMDYNIVGGISPGIDDILVMDINDTRYFNFVSGDSIIQVVNNTVTKMVGTSSVDYQIIGNEIVFNAFYGKAARGAKRVITYLYDDRIVARSTQTLYGFVNNSDLPEMNGPPEAYYYKSQKSEDGTYDIISYEAYAYAEEMKPIAIEYNSDKTEVTAIYDYNIYGLVIPIGGSELHYISDSSENEAYTVVGSSGTGYIKDAIFVREPDSGNPNELTDMGQVLYGNGPRKVPYLYKERVDFVTLESVYEAIKPNHDFNHLINIADSNAVNGRQYVTYHPNFFVFPQYWWWTGGPGTELEYLERLEDWKQSSFDFADNDFYANHSWGNVFFHGNYGYGWGGYGGYGYGGYGYWGGYWGGWSGSSLGGWNGWSVGWWYHPLLITGQSAETLNNLGTDIFENIFVPQTLNLRAWGYMPGTTSKDRLRSIYLYKKELFNNDDGDDPDEILITKIWNIVYQYNEVTNEIYYIDQNGAYVVTRNNSQLSSTIQPYSRKPIDQIYSILEGLQKGFEAAINLLRTKPITDIFDMYGWLPFYYEVVDGTNGYILFVKIKRFISETIGILNFGPIPQKTYIKVDQGYSCGVPDWSLIADIYISHIGRYNNTFEHYKRMHSVIDGLNNTSIAKMVSAPLTQTSKSYFSKKYNTMVANGVISNNWALYVNVVHPGWRKESGESVATLGLYSTNKTFHALEITNTKVLIIYNSNNTYDIVKDDVYDYSDYEIDIGGLDGFAPHPITFRLRNFYNRYPGHYYFNNYNIPNWDWYSYRAGLSVKGDNINRYRDYLFSLKSEPFIPTGLRVVNINSPLNNNNSVKYNLCNYNDYVLNLDGNNIATAHNTDYEYIASDFADGQENMLSKDLRPSMAVGYGISNGYVLNDAMKYTSIIYNYRGETNGDFIFRIEKKDKSISELECNIRITTCADIVDFISNNGCIAYVIKDGILSETNSISFAWKDIKDGTKRRSEISIAAGPYENSVVNIVGFKDGEIAWKNRLFMEPRLINRQTEAERAYNSYYASHSGHPSDYRTPIIQRMVAYDDFILLSTNHSKIIPRGIDDTREKAQKSYSDVQSYCSWLGNKEIEDIIDIPYKKKFLQDF